MNPQTQNRQEKVQKSAKEPSRQADDYKTEVEILLAYSQEDWEQRRQSENQRATITNFIITIASAILIYIVEKGLSTQQLPLTIFLIPLGIFGAVAVSKLYERGEYHMASTQAWRKRVDELYPKAQLLNLRNQAKEAHAKKFGMVIREWVRLHSIWASINLVIALIGGVLTLAILLTTQP